MYNIYESFYFIRRFYWSTFTCRITRNRNSFMLEFMILFFNVWFSRDLEIVTQDRIYLIIFLFKPFYFRLNYLFLFFLSLIISKKLTRTSRVRKYPLKTSLNFLEMCETLSSSIIGRGVCVFLREYKSICLGTTIFHINRFANWNAASPIKTNSFARGNIFN